MDKWEYLRFSILEKKIVSCFDIGEVPVLEVVRIGIGTGLAFCHSFSLSNNVRGVIWLLTSVVFLL